MSLEEIAKLAKEQNRTVLTELEAKQVLGDAGISCTATKLAASKGEAVALSEEIGYPVVLKVSSVDISHKSDAGGVKVNLKDKAAVEKAFDEIMASAKAYDPKAVIEGVTVQEMAKPGVEIVIGMINDANFGPCIMFGLGGIFVEVLKDVTFRIVPLDKNDAAEMIKEIKGYKILQGVRGQEAVDTAFLEDTLLKLSDFLDKNPNIAELDMNPVFAYSDGASVVDARMVLKD